MPFPLARLPGTSLAWVPDTSKEPTLRVLIAREYNRWWQQRPLPIEKRSGGRHRRATSPAGTVAIALIPYVPDRWRGDASLALSLNFGVSHQRLAFLGDVPWDCPVRVLDSPTTARERVFRTPDGIEGWASIQTDLDAAWTRFAELSAEGALTNALLSGQPDPTDWPAYLATAAFRWWSGDRDGGMRMADEHFARAAWTPEFAAHPPNRAYCDRAFFAACLEQG